MSHPKTLLEWIAQELHESSPAAQRDLLREIPSNFVLAWRTEAGMFTLCGGALDDTLTSEAHMRVTKKLHEEMTQAKLGSMMSLGVLFGSDLSIGRA